MSDPATPPKKPRFVEPQTQSIVAVDYSPNRRFRVRSESSTSSRSARRREQAETTLRNLEAREAPSPSVDSGSEEETTLTESSRRELETWLTNRLLELKEKSLSNVEIRNALEVAQEQVLGSQQQNSRPS